MSRRRTRVPLTRRPPSPSHSSLSTRHTWQDPGRESLYDDTSTYGNVFTEYDNTRETDKPRFRYPPSTTPPADIGFRFGNIAVLPPRPAALQFKRIVNEPNDQFEQEADRVADPVMGTPQGLPDRLRNGLENLSGYSMDDTRVHYNSSKPAQFNALAYAQGNQIHLGSGQEKHLPHEAWHVVQQKQGRVRPTMQMKGGVEVNDDVGLEREADFMGGRALQTKVEGSEGSLKKSSDPFNHMNFAGEADSNIGEKHSAKQGAPRINTGAHLAPRTSTRKSPLNLLSPRGVGVGVMQRVIDTTLGGMAPSGPIPNNAFTPLPNANITVKKIKGTTSPVDPPGMSTWKPKGYLRDPSKPRTNLSLTRMHAIRGRFGGPSAANNMFLGTALSNNFHPNSHYNEVEQPLERYLKGAGRGEVRAFDYTVSPVTGVSPPYMEARINNPAEVNPTDAAGFRAFAHDQIPHGFNCTATLYRKVGNAVTSKTVQQNVGTDVGVPTSVPAPITTAPVGVSEARLRGAGRWGLPAIVGGLVLGGPVGWALLGVGAIGAIYGYATAEDD